MKKVTCDRCGKEFVGRNPLDFYEHVLDKRVYVDLCKECNGEYNKLINQLDHERTIKIEKFLDTFMVRVDGVGEIPVYKQSGGTKDEI